MILYNQIYAVGENEMPDTKATHDGDWTQLQAAYLRITAPLMQEVEALKKENATLRIANAALILKLDAVRQNAHAACDDMAGELLTLRALINRMDALAMSGKWSGGALSEEAK